MFTETSFSAERLKLDCDKESRKITDNIRKIVTKQFKKRGVVEKDARRRIYMSHINKLRIYESDLRLIRGDIEGARVVRQEISAVREELAAPPRVEEEVEVPVEASSFIMKETNLMFIRGTRFSVFSWNNVTFLL